MTDQKDQKKRIEDGLAALRSALATLTQLQGWEQQRALFAALFGLPSDAHIAGMFDALGKYSTGNPDSAAVVNKIASEMVGSPIELAREQLVAFRRFFYDDYYGPINPMAQDTADESQAFRKFYAALLTRDADLAAARDLQRKIGDLWADGGQDQEERVRKALREIEPSVAWDARHLFSLTMLFTLDLAMKPLAPWDPSESVW